MLAACQGRDEEEFASASGIPRSGHGLLTPQGQAIRLDLAITKQEKAQGLSGMPADAFSDDQGLLFFYRDSAPRQFWMPDTYFDLDIFFLDADLTILDVERDVEHHPGRDDPSSIPTTRRIVARHVLELKASSPISKSLRIGDTLTWTTSPTFEEISQQLTGP